MRKRIIRRPVARRDLEDAAFYYRERGGAALARRFVRAVDDAFRFIACHPEAGSPRYELTRRIDGLRSWRLADFPYLVFYLEREDRIDVVRILHTQRDLEFELNEAPAGPVQRKHD